MGADNVNDNGNDMTVTMRAQTITMVTDTLFLDVVEDANVLQL